MKNIFCIGNNVSEKVFDGILHKIDKDGNKVISYIEFRDMMKEIIIKD